MNFDYDLYSGVALPAIRICEVQLNYTCDEIGWPRSALINLDFAIRELRKALIYKGVLRGGKTPKAGVAGSIPSRAHQL